MNIYFQVPHRRGVLPQRERLFLKEEKKERKNNFLKMGPYGQIRAGCHSRQKPELVMNWRRFGHGLKRKTMHDMSNGFNFGVI